MTEWDLQKLFTGRITTELQQHLFRLSPFVNIMIFKTSFNRNSGAKCSCVVSPRFRVILVPHNIVWLNICKFTTEKQVLLNATVLRVKWKQLSTLICKRAGRIKVLNSAGLTRQQLWVGETNPHLIWCGYPFFFLCASFHLTSYWLPFPHYFPWLRFYPTLFP